MAKGRAAGGVFGATYTRVGPVMDRRGATAHRRELLGAAFGRVVEIGAGYGATFPLYPGQVTGVIAVEPDETLRTSAKRAAKLARVPIEVVDGFASALPLGDGSVDVAVSSLVLCSVPDQSAALAELHRVLRPGGLLLMYEHVRSRHLALAILEDLLAPVWSGLAGGCHPNRDTVAGARAAGFQIQHQRRFGFSILAGIPAVSHVIVAARKLPIGE